jgi:hypothetical protein
MFRHQREFEPIDTGKIHKNAPVINFNSDIKKEKISRKKIVKESKPEVIVEEIKPIKEVKSKSKTKVEEIKVEESKPKKVKLEKGSEEAKQWGLLMKQKRDAKKAELKLKITEEEIPETM